VAAVVGAAVVVALPALGFGTISSLEQDREQ
jgi:hypothetical protein